MNFKNGDVLNNIIQKHRENLEILSFQYFVANKNIYATVILLAIILVAFLCEEIRGGSNEIFVLLNMGANSSILVKNGEYFRLASSVFLHAGFLHVIFNSYVLYSLGAFCNKILGNIRFLFVFLVSGLTGSLASVYLSHSKVSVGASGAIWGFFGASLFLAFFNNPFIPATIRANLKRVTLINLLINLGVSLLPMVDFWAHIGGGVGGFFSAVLISQEINNKWGQRILRIFLISVVILLIFLYGFGLFKLFFGPQIFSKNMFN